jgi:type I restriction enzyme M protein
VDRIECELLEMFANPEVRKRYYAIVDIADIEENEFNLNIPRYVDTFGPEEEIQITAAIGEFEDALASEVNVTQS